MEPTTTKRPRGRPPKNKQNITTTPDLDKNNTKVMAPPKSAKNKKVVVLTGATSGMGLKILESLAIEGHTIIAVGRNPSACRDALQLARSFNSDANIAFLLADLSVMSQVKTLASDIAQKLEKFGVNHIDVVYHSAGVMTQNIQQTYEHHETQWATNYLSVVLLTELLIPFLLRSKEPRVVVVTTKPNNKQKLDFKEIQNPKNASKMYEYSKLADLMFAMQFNEELKHTNIHAYAVYPGNVQTDLGAKHTKGFKNWLEKLKRKHAVSITDAVQTSLYLITAPKLPPTVVLYSNFRPLLPCDYALNPFNRERLWRATRTKLDLPETPNLEEN